jgi:hypothetical protein
VQERTATRRPDAYLSYRGLYWRSISGLLLFQAAGWALAAGLAYLIARPEIARGYFSAHQSVSSALALLLPALAVSAGAGFLVVGVGSALGVWRYSRRLREPLRQVDGLLRQLAAGQIPTPGPPARRPRPADEAAALLAPLRDHVLELQRITKALEKLVLELNYRAGSGGDLRGLAGQLDVLVRELSESVGWFEG